MSDDDITGEGFTVQDKRAFTKNGDPRSAEPDSASGSEPAPGTSGKGHTAPESPDAVPPLPDVNFSTFILSLSSSALFHFGTIPDPVSQQIQRNLPLAKQTIDILGVLQEKTKGNLSEEESALLVNLLYDLRLRYVEELKKTPRTP
jgi:hypothetical protein